MKEFVKVQDITKTYKMGEVEIHAVDHISFSIEQGELVVIVGPSGAGKTTVLNILGGMDTATSGKLYVDGKDITAYNSKQLTGYRRDDIGFVFQFYNLVPNLTALENVVLSMNISGKHFDTPKKELALELLQKVSLSPDEANRRVLKLSGGQQQRVAIARALSYDPDIILADEPTGNLDEETQDEIIRIFRLLADEGKCVILVTHSPIVAQAADYVYELPRH